ncbi:hypothetical protein ACFY0N_11225 [Streptomyces vinaceus]
MGFTAKYRIPLVAACAVVAAAGGLLAPAAFGTEDAGTTASAGADPSATPEEAALPEGEAPDAADGDAAVSADDHTPFGNGVMSIGGSRTAGAPRPAAVAGATPPQGEGWKLSGATKWLATGYTIKFYDQKSADWLAPYVKATAADLQRITNIPVAVDTRPVGWDYSRPRGEVVIGVAHRPCVPPAAEGSMGSTGWKVVRDGSGSANLSCGFTSSSLADTVTSGHAYIDDEFFTSAGKPTASMGEAVMRNHVSHEIGHTLGLTHANRSMTKGDCVKGTDSGEFPVMCTPTYAYKDKRAGTYV